jgi:hypothetical protein
MRARLPLALLAGVSLAASAAPARAADAPRPDVSIKTSIDRRTGMAGVPVNVLIAAAARGDRAELGRAAERLGSARIATLLGDADKGAVLAALEAVRVLEGNVRLIGAITPLLADSDARVAARAAAVMGQLLRSDRPGELESWDIPSDEVASACKALGRATERANSALPARLAAFDALADAHAVCPRLPGLALASGDSWPEIRRAALLAPQTPGSLPLSFIGDLTGDPVPKVAGAAAAVFCRQRLESLRTRAADDADRGRLGRLRSIALVEATPAEDVMDVLPCLAVSRDPEDQRALETLRKRAGTPLGDRAAQLTGAVDRR